MHVFVKEDLLQYFILEVYGLFQSSQPVTTVASATQQVAPGSRPFTGASYPPYQFQTGYGQFQPAPGSGLPAQQSYTAPSGGSGKYHHQCNINFNPRPTKSASPLSVCPHFVSRPDESMPDS